MRKVLVCGAGGFIGNHIVNRLKEGDCRVTGVDLNLPNFSSSRADEFVVGDLQDPLLVKGIFDQEFDEVYQLAADMGGAGYIFSGENDANVMHNSCLINLNVLKACVESKSKKIFYSSSACVYPERNQMNAEAVTCAEDSVYPAAPDSEYGWEKLYSERMYLAFQRNYNLEVRIARFHNIFGPGGTWRGGREKAPAALCRKVAESPDGGEIEIWGDGQQMRSFLYIDECIDAVFRLMESSFTGPVNIGSEEMICVTDLAKKIMSIAGKNLSMKNIPGPEGVRCRTSDNRLLAEKLSWQPSRPLDEGLASTYTWINEQHQQCMRETVQLAQKAI